MNVIQRLRYAPFFTQLVVIRRCNLSCTYCNEFDKTSSPIPLHTLKERAKKIKELGAFSICLTGGEPTMHPHLTDLICYCRSELGFFKTSLITNGYYLTPKMIKDLNEAGLQDLQISIDGVKPNKTTVKVLDCLKKRLQYLKDHAEFEVVVSGVIGACPPQESFQVIQYAKDMGFRPRVLLVHDGDGQVRLSNEELKVYASIKKMISRHLYEFSDYRYRMITNGRAPFKCRAGSRYLYVDEFGKVNWCSQTRAFFSKDLMDYTFYDLKEQFYSYKSCQDCCTLGCVRSSSAFDQWRGQKAPPVRHTDSVLSV